MNQLLRTVSASAGRLRAPSNREMAAIQSAYYLPSAAAPLMSRRSFEAITGPKVDWWLVETVGALVGVVGGALALAARRDAPSAETPFLGLGAAVALGVIDITYVARRRIRPVYLVDAVIELSLSAGWALALWNGSRPRRPA